MKSILRQQPQSWAVAVLALLAGASATYLGDATTGIVVFVIVLAIGLAANFAARKLSRP